MFAISCRRLFMCWLSSVSIILNEIPTNLKSIFCYCIFLFFNLIVLIQRYTYILYLKLLS